MRARTKALFICLPLFMTINVFLFFLPIVNAIAFYHEDQNDLLGYLPVRDDDLFQIQYTHSIHLTDVKETYTLRNNKIIQTELEYENFAVGMPSNVEGEGKFLEKDGKFFIKNMEREFSYIDLRIGQVQADHRIVYQGNSYKLADFFGPGSWVRIKPAKISIWQQVKGVNIRE